MHVWNRSKLRGKLFNKVRHLTPKPKGYRTTKYNSWCPFQVSKNLKMDLRSIEPIENFWQRRPRQSWKLKQHFCCTKLIFKPMAMAKKKFEVSMEEMNIELHRQVDVNSDILKNMNCQSHQNNSNKHERNGNSKEGWAVSLRTWAVANAQTSETTEVYLQVRYSLLQKKGIWGTRYQSGVFTRKLYVKFFSRQCSIHSFSFKFSISDS